MTGNSAVHTVPKKKSSSRAEKILQWFHSSVFKCVLLDVVAFLLILMIFFIVCVPKKYNLSVGSISHYTINATKDVTDEVSTQEKKNTVAAQVEPKYLLQQGVKEEVVSALSKKF